MRSQNYLTLLAIDARPVGGVGDRRHLTREVARVISRQVRETDLLSRRDEGRLFVVLFDANFQSSLTVVDRLISRFEQYEFTAPAAISVGAACCPTHGTDAEQLRLAAEAQLVHTSNANREALRTE
jgi:diguanylate cyclase (GGDEF)-like protein